jgi:hypothetical protein
MEPGAMGASLLCAGIRWRLLVEFEYDGFHRVVQPYCHGTNARHEVLRGVQVRGGSRSGGLGFGKLWLIGKMTNVRCSDEKFVPDDPGYNPEDRAILQIHCRI